MKKKITTNIQDLRRVNIKIEISDDYEKDNWTDVTQYLETEIKDDLFDDRFIRLSKNSKVLILVVCGMKYPFGLKIFDRYVYKNNIISLEDKKENVDYVKKGDVFYFISKMPASITSASKLSNVFENLDKFNISIDNPGNVLVYCHDKPVEGTENVSKHLQYSIFEKLCGEKGVTSPIYDTVDLVKPVNQDYKRHYKADGFSSQFIKENEGKYKLVFVPDCAGLWIKKMPLEDRVKLCIKMTKLLESKGTIYFGKFSNSNIDEVKEEAVKSYSNNYNINVIENNIDQDNPIKYLSIEKRN